MTSLKSATLASRPRADFPTHDLFRSCRHTGQFRSGPAGGYIDDDYPRKRIDERTCRDCCRTPKKVADSYRFYRRMGSKLGGLRGAWRRSVAGELLQSILDGVRLKLLRSDTWLLPEQGWTTETGGFGFGYEICRQAVLASFRCECSSTLPTIERQAAAGMGICYRGLVCEG